MAWVNVNSYLIVYTNIVTVWRKIGTHQWRFQWLLSSKSQANVLYFSESGGHLRFLLSTNGCFELLLTLSHHHCCHHSHTSFHRLHDRIALSFLVLIAFPRVLTPVLTLTVITFIFLISSTWFWSCAHLYILTLWIHWPYQFLCLYPFSFIVNSKIHHYNHCLAYSSPKPPLLHLARSNIPQTPNSLQVKTSWPCLSDDSRREISHISITKPSAYLLSCSHGWIVFIPEHFTGVLDPLHSYLRSGFSPEVSPPVPRIMNFSSYWSLWSLGTISRPYQQSLRLPQPFSLPIILASSDKQYQSPLSVIYADDMASIHLLFWWGLSLTGDEMGTRYLSLKAP